jgi:hypothetical protein
MIFANVLRTDAMNRLNKAITLRNAPRLMPNDLGTISDFPRGEKKFLVTEYRITVRPFHYRTAPAEAAAPSGIMYYAS